MPTNVRAFEPRRSSCSRDCHLGVCTCSGQANVSKVLPLMSVIEKSEHSCMVCGQRTEHQRKKRWTVPNIAATIATLGLWALRPGDNWSCGVCGALCSEIFCVNCGRKTEQTRLTENDGSLWQCTVCAEKHRYRKTAAVGPPPDMWGG